MSFHRWSFWVHVRFAKQRRQFNSESVTRAAVILLPLPRLRYDAFSMSTTDITITPALGILGTLNLLGAAQGVLLGLALLSANAANKTANRILAALIFSISIIVSGAVLLTSYYVFYFPHLSRVHHPVVFLAGPLLFLYIEMLTSQKNRLEKKDLLHFLPFLFCFIYLLPYYLQSSAAKLQVLGAEYLAESFGTWYYIRSAIFITQFLVYLVLIVLSIVKYSRRTRAQNLASDRAVLFEIRFFVIASTLLWLGAIVRYALDSGGSTNLLVPLGASVMVYAMGYLKMRRPAMDPAGSGETEESDTVAARKYEKSMLTPARSERYLNKLLQLMETERPYTDGDLTIQKLAQQLAIPLPHLSQTINERLGKSFPDFINSYRVAEAKKKLLDPALKHLSVLGIAEEVGFNSKSSFNAVFKKHTDMTPSEFRNALGSNHN
jgi:AraC-like DNA-binding protein